MKFKKSRINILASGLSLLSSLQPYKNNKRSHFSKNKTFQNPSTPREEYQFVNDLRKDESKRRVNTPRENCCPFFVFSGDELVKWTSTLGNGVLYNFVSYRRKKRKPFRDLSSQFHFMDVWATCFVTFTSLALFLPHFILRKQPLRKSVINLVKLIWKRERVNSENGGGIWNSAS